MSFPIAWGDIFKNLLKEYEKLCMKKKHKWIQISVYMSIKHACLSGRPWEHWQGLFTLNWKHLKNKFFNNEHTTQYISAIFGHRYRYFRQKCLLNSSNTGIIYQTESIIYNDNIAGHVTCIKPVFFNSVNKRARY